MKTNTVLKSNPMTPLMGSYAPEDCLFLLQEINPNYQSIENKEMLIQTGQMHYSEMINKEAAPTEEYLALFLAMTEQYKARLAAEVMRLASIIADKRPGFGKEGQEPIALLSLARAGTPIGVLLKRALKMMGLETTHYAISIVRDRGIDEMALEYARERHSDESICFIDGWTAKGVITRELHEAVADYNTRFNANVPTELFVVSDIGGTADYTATYADYTIPSALMNSTVSGLTSRTILNEQTEGGFHGCVVYRNLAEHDKSVWFIEQICSQMNVNELSPVITESQSARQKMTKDYLNSIQSEFGITDINRIKPGIAEATRVMLRRVPDVLIIREAGHPDVAHLEQIAKEKGIEMRICPEMPFGACALIKDVTKG